MRSSLSFIASSSAYLRLSSSVGVWSTYTTGITERGRRGFSSAPISIPRCRVGSTHASQSGSSSIRTVSLVTLRPPLPSRPHRTRPGGPRTASQTRPRSDAAPHRGARGASARRHRTGGPEPAPGAGPRRPDRDRARPAWTPEVRRRRPSTTTSGGRGRGPARQPPRGSPGSAGPEARATTRAGPGAGPAGRAGCG